MAKKIPLSLLIGCISLNAFSQNNFHALIVKLIDGTCDEYIVANHPKVTLCDETTTIDAKDLSTKYETANISEYFFKTLDMTPIDEVKTEDCNLNLRIRYVDQETIQVSGAKAESAITLYSIDGKMVQTKVNNTGNTIYISLNGLSKGAYILKIGKEQTIKIAKR